MYDIIIIGGGCAGLSAAMYSSRYEMKVLVLTKLPGGLITSTHLVENYPGVSSWTGMEMGQKFVEHAKKFGAEIKIATTTNIQKENDKTFTIKTSSDSFQGKTVVIATGSEHRHLEIPGEKEYANKGVSYCAVCDAAFYKEKVVAIIGGSDSAAKEALLMTEFAKKVYMIYRGKEIRPEPINKKRVMENKKIEIINNSNLKEICGNENKVTHVITKDNQKIELNGIFVAIGHLPQSELAEKLGVQLSNKKEIIIDHESKTNIEGVYAAGDVTHIPFKQAIISAAQGAYAATSAYEYLK
jgi:thioredoxin reductase (NADPH)